MFALLLQDLVTVKSTLGATALAQGETHWLDCGPYQDVVFWLDLRYANPAAGELELHYETAPVRDPALFVDVVSALALSDVPGVYMTKALLSGATNPAAQWLRWRLVAPTAPASWEACFRIYVTANRAAPLSM